MGAIAGRVDRNAPMGATVAADGTGFRTWAPRARAVGVIAGPDLAASRADGWTPAGLHPLEPLGDGSWGGFLAGLRDGDPYLFFIRGEADGETGGGWKRDPFARELSREPAFPESFCLVRDPATYPWHDAGWHPPAYGDLVIYQLHVGAFWAQDAAGGDVRASRSGTFLDVAARLDHLAALGVNAIQLLPIQEFETRISLGYNGSDLFSPDIPYCVGPDDLGWRLDAVNARLAGFGKAPLSRAELAPGINQLKALVDLCHLHGIAVIFDLVFNHAGGGGPVWGLDDRSLWFYDRMRDGDRNDSLYFTDQEWTGPVFAYWNPWVSQFLIDNARFLLAEYHADGFRYDEISAVVNHGGADFCRNLTRTVRAANPAAIQIAEYWNGDRATAIRSGPDGLGFDAELADGLRDALRGLLRQASAGESAALDLARVAAALAAGFDEPWRLDQCLENHDLTWAGHGDAERVAMLADPADPSGWYARSRCRAAAALLFTAPGIPSLFMGQEWLEDRTWNDNRDASSLIRWDGPTGPDPARHDMLGFHADLIHLRHAEPALRAGGVRVSRADDFERVLVLHRWVEGEGRDVVVIVSFDEGPKRDYRVGLPFAGRWHERFNSDVYDGFPNPAPVGNGGAVTASGPPWDGFAASALVSIPANGALVLTRG